MTYTKGPWRYEPGTREIRTVQGEYRLAELDCCATHVLFQVDANGIAMAATPNLIAALKLAESTLRRLQAIDGAQGTLDVIRIALAEAGA